MRALVDTHVLLWWLADDDRLPLGHRAFLADPENEAVVSAVSVAEIAIKASLGKLEAPVIDGELLRAEGFRVLPLDAAHSARLRALPWHHRDPFDRMLVAQAQEEAIPLLTVDARIAAYDVRIRAGDPAAG